MKLTVVRTQLGKDATNGILLIDGVFECYTLEDQYQAVKVMHETCIPEGTYNIKFRNTGGFHHGMLHLQNVPGFTYILIHAGNTDEHTSGCLIVGETQQDLDISDDGFIGHSGKAYSKLYDKVSKKLLIGESVSIEYTTIDKLLNPKQNKLSGDKKLDTIIAKLENIENKIKLGRIIR